MTPDVGMLQQSDKAVSFRKFPNGKRKMVHSYFGTPGLRDLNGTTGFECGPVFLLFSYLRCLLSAMPTVRPGVEPKNIQVWDMRFQKRFKIPLQ